MGGSREDRQECESTNELTALLTTAESKVQDKHQMIMCVFMFIYRVFQQLEKQLRLENCKAFFLSVLC